MHNLHPIRKKKRKDEKDEDEDSEDSESDDDEEEGPEREPKLKVAGIQHNGCINRLKYQSLGECPKLERIRMTTSHFISKLFQHVFKTFL